MILASGILLSGEAKHKDIVYKAQELTETLKRFFPQERFITNQTL